MTPPRSALPVALALLAAFQPRPASRPGAMIEAPGGPGGGDPDGG